MGASGARIRLSLTNCGSSISDDCPTEVERSFVASDFCRDTDRDVGTDTGKGASLKAGLAYPRSSDRSAELLVIDGGDDVEFSDFWGSGPWS